MNLIIDSFPFKWILLSFILFTLLGLISYFLLRKENIPLADRSLMLSVLSSTGGLIVFIASLSI